MVKIKTLVPNVLKYGQEKGATLEVERHVADHLISKKKAEEVKAQKPQAPKKNDKKNKEGE